jgi:hypothetical protein
MRLRSTVEVKVKVGYRRLRNLLHRISLEDTGGLLETEEPYMSDVAVPRAMACDALLSRTQVIRLIIAQQ